MTTLQQADAIAAFPIRRSREDVCLASLFLTTANTNPLFDCAEELHRQLLRESSSRERSRSEIGQIGVGLSRERARKPLPEHLNFSATVRTNFEQQHSRVYGHRNEIRRHATEAKSDVSRCSCPQRWSSFVRDGNKLTLRKNGQEGHVVIE